MATGNPSDEELWKLVGEFKKGDEMAAAELFTRVMPRVRYILSRFYGTDRHALEDAVADVRAKIIANISRVNPTPNGTFLGWCSVVAYRHGINYRARASTRYEFNVPGDEMSEFEDPVTIPPDESLQVRERRLALEKALALLHRKDRTCIVLRFRDGLSTREIASILLETEGAISNRIMRAKRKLKKLFLKYDV